MRHIALILAVPCALALSACTTVTPAFKDIGSRNSPCVKGGPDSVAQQFYDYLIQHRAGGSNNIAALRPYLSDNLYQVLIQANTSKSSSALLNSNPFSSSTVIADQARVASASTIPNTDAHNIPLRVTQTQWNQKWQDEVLMIREGQCWVVDDVRYLDGTAHAPAGTLRQSLIPEQQQK